MVRTCGGGHAAGCPNRNLAGIDDGGKVGGDSSVGVEDVMLDRVLTGWRVWALGRSLWFWAFLVSSFLFGLNTDYYLIVWVQNQFNS